MGMGEVLVAMTSVHSKGGMMEVGPLIILIPGPFNELLGWIIFFWELHFHVASAARVWWCCFTCTLWHRVNLLPGDLSSEIKLTLFLFQSYRECTASNPCSWELPAQDLDPFNEEDRQGPRSKLGANATAMFCLANTQVPLAIKI